MQFPTRLSIRHFLLSSLVLATLLYSKVTPVRAQGWKLPLREKESALEENIRERHNILGLYPSVVEIPRHGGPVDITTATPHSDVVHAVAWTSHYLAGASYRYLWLRENGAPDEQVEDARRRADEIFEAVYRCQRVTGRRGLLARGYLLGTGPTFDERRGASHKDDWYQGTADGYNLRFCAGPSHHIYSAAAMGMGQYYDLVASGEQKERAREAIDALVSHWVDNDYRIACYNEKRRLTFSILGFTDGRTLNTRVMMAISAARIAHHVTGKEKFLQAFEDLVSRYRVRELAEFRTNKGYDDAHHVFAHLDILHRIEKDSAMRAAYAKIADGLWKHYAEEGHSHFTYIYYHLRPDAPGKKKALRAAQHTLETWPVDMTIQPIMTSLHPEIQPPYPVYATGWDNEFIWKGSLLRPNARPSRIASDIAVSREAPYGAAVVDPRGHLYLTHDQASSERGWKCISDPLSSPVRAVAFGEKTRVIAVACDDGFYVSRTAGQEWQKLPLKTKWTPLDVEFDRAYPHVLYAMTHRTIHRGSDHGEELIGMAWKDLGEQLPAGLDFHFKISPQGDSRLSTVHALHDSSIFSHTDESNSSWRRTVLGLGKQGASGNWLAVTPENPGRLIFGVRVGGGGGFPTRTLFQESRDDGASWSNSPESVTKAFHEGTLVALLERFPRHDFRDLQFAPGSASQLYALDSHGVVRTNNQEDNWSPLMEGLKIPRVERLFSPAHGDRIYASTPAGIFHLEHGETEWQSSHLVMQWRKNERRELGGASFITAYWRALYFGLLR